VTNIVISFLACIILIVVFGKIFFVPLRRVLKLIANSILGGMLIYIINFVGSLFNFHIGLNVITSIFVGILGIPGAVLLVVFKVILG